MKFNDILHSHFDRYPVLQIQDVYKLAFQAAMGNEHAALDPAAALRWLEQEIADLGSGPVEPLVDPISPDGQLVRVHLRPYAQQAHSPTHLVDAFLATAKEYRGRVSVLEEFWQAAVRLNHFPAVEMDTFFQEMKASNYPAVHHSYEYRQAYRPAYRVILRKYIEGL